jgi:hypothetical protein
VIQTSYPGLRYSVWCHPESGDPGFQSYFLITVVPDFGGPYLSWTSGMNDSAGHSPQIQLERVSHTAHYPEDENYELQFEAGGTWTPEFLANTRLNNRLQFGSNPMRTADLDLHLTWTPGGCRAQVLMQVTDEPGDGNY